MFFGESETAMEMDEFDRSFYELMKKKYVIDRMAYDFHKRRLELERSLCYNYFKTGTKGAFCNIVNNINDMKCDAERVIEDKLAYETDDEISRSVYSYNEMREEGCLRDAEDTSSDQSVDEINRSLYDHSEMREAGCLREVEDVSPVQSVIDFEGSETDGSAEHYDASDSSKRYVDVKI